MANLTPGPQRWRAQGPDVSGGNVRPDPSYHGRPDGDRGPNVTTGSDKLESAQSDRGAVGALEARYRERSLWLSGIERPLTPRASLQGDVGCDVAIVGAGFTGLWTAYYLKRHAPTLSVVVVEREIRASGPSGRNGGWVMSGIAGTARAYGERPESDVMVRAARETGISAVDEVDGVVDCRGDRVRLSQGRRRDRRHDRAVARARLLTVRLGAQRSRRRRSDARPG